MADSWLYSQTANGTVFSFAGAMWNHRLVVHGYDAISMALKCSVSAPIWFNWIKIELAMPFRYLRQRFSVRHEQIINDNLGWRHRSRLSQIFPAVPIPDSSNHLRLGELHRILDSPGYLKNPETIGIKLLPSPARAICSVFIKTQ